MIARPFAGRDRAFTRTDARRDFSIRPPGRSYLEAVRDAGSEVHAVGKIAQLLPATCWS